MQHFHRLSQLNYSVDEGLYPLGSCTMKYNPRLCERVSRLPGFTDVHPLQPDQQVQGALRLLWEVEQMLCAVTGMAGVTVQHGCRRARRARRYAHDPGRHRSARGEPDLGHHSRLRPRNESRIRGIRGV